MICTTCGQIKVYGPGGCGCKNVKKFDYIETNGKVYVPREQYDKLKSSHDELYEKNVQLLEAAKKALTHIRKLNYETGGELYGDPSFELEQAIARAEQR